MELAMFNIPNCFFPTSTVLVDDDCNYLNNLTTILSENLAYRTINSSVDALAIIKADHNTNFLESIKGIESFQQSLPNLGIAAPLLESILANPLRFQCASVLIVDYAMPKINGLELCEQLQNLPIKKILLTGKADEKTAIEAFNAQVIDMYIQKQDISLISAVNNAIKKLQKKYFIQLIEQLSSSLPINHEFFPNNIEFYEYFDEIIRKNNILEYYPIDSTGNFLFIDKKGTISILVTKSKEDLDGIIDIAKDSGASDSIINAIKENKKVPFFSSNKEFALVQNDQWENYLHPANVIVGKNRNYVCAHITPVTQINGVNNLSEIKSFEYYMDNLWQPHG